MADLHYVIYDSVDFTNAVGNFTLFQIPQGGDATHVESFTNMRGGGQFPTDETFLIKKVGFVVDHNPVLADLLNMWYLSFLEIRVNDFTVFKSPLQALSQYNAYAGHYSEASASNEALIGLKGDGFALDIPIKVPGGTQFKVNVYQGTALSTTGRRMKVLLEGVLTVKQN